MAIEGRVFFEQQADGMQGASGEPAGCQEAGNPKP